MVNIAGQLFVVLGLTLLGMLAVIGSWVLANELIKVGLGVYKDILDMRSDIRDHEGRKQKP